MATIESSSDALLSFRQAIAANIHPILTTSSEPASADNTTSDLSQATHLQFHHPDNKQDIFSLSSSTRFETNGKAIDLRSVLFAWQRKDDAITDYISATRKLNEDLPGGAGGSVQNLVFADRLDLISWLEGQSDESENIKPLAGDAAKTQAQAAGAADIAAGATVGSAATTGSTALRAPGASDARLQEIYNGERKMGDRNSILRGIKPTDFSHIRKHAEAFIGRSRTKPGQPGAPPGSIPQNPALAANRAKPGRRMEPIILLSPSASSLLRMSNIKSFLEGGIYTDADSTAGANLLQISRLLPSIDPQRPLRFILVDSPDQFKPDYWSRVVAVFTTGQQWQFKSYKWQDPPELFSHTLGIYVGWRGEQVPQAVKAWGRGVMTMQIEKYHAAQGAQGRWRDREIVEAIWTSIEESMRSRWNKDGLIAR